MNTLFRKALTAALAKLDEEEVREVVREAKPGWHIAKNGGPRKKEEKGNAE